MRQELSAQADITFSEPRMMATRHGEETMPQPRTLVLDAEQRTSLDKVLRHDHRPYLREQAAALLKISDGMNPSSVAMGGLLRRRKPDTVRGWLDYYLQHGHLHVRPATRGFSPQ
ncbi:MAG TPA: hypothetical protein VFZ20_11785 [Longimicrobium sp.]|nr:hypothetical protein [Longimicrobium sp.]